MELTFTKIRTSARNHPEAVHLAGIEYDRHMWPNLQSILEKMKIETPTTISTDSFVLLR